MLFNSIFFIFGFLPLTLCVYSIIEKKTHNGTLAKIWLILSSFFFYGWWNFEYLFLLLASIVFNFLISSVLLKSASKRILIFGIASNLLLLAYYKYLDFFVFIVNEAFGETFQELYIILPLAISFITFQQIAFLVDSYYKNVKSHSLVNYSLFVSFFPQLISGPIVHHNEMMPQFETRKRSYLIIAAGLTIFFLGLFKKTVIADSFAKISNNSFDVAENGEYLTLIDSWIGAFSYTFQLYFDFSGYCDMAIGLGLFFGIFLPINFNSPLKAKSIIDFWRRWHITLSRFLKNYLYIPMGGNRKGTSLKLIFLMITMVLGGFWHGASFNFVIWGTIHGLLLVINHLFKSLISQNSQIFRVINMFSWGVTFLCVVLSFVVFKADSLIAANYMYSSMLPSSGNPAPVVQNLYDVNEYIKILVGLSATLFIVKFFPNTNEIIGYFPDKRIIYPKVWQPNVLGAVVISIVILISLVGLLVNSNEEFLYRFF